MDMEAGKTLTNEEVIRELLELLKKNAMKEQANDVFEICSYVDVLEKKIDSMTEELTNQIYRTREKGSIARSMGSGYQVQNWADQVLQQKLIKNKNIRIIPIESKWSAPSD